MRLPVRLAGRSALFVIVAGVAAAQAQQRPELTGGGLIQAPLEITSIEATAPQTTEAAPQPFGFENEVHCFGYIGPDGERFTTSIIGAESGAEQEDFTSDDLLYLDAGHDRGIKAGDEFWIITPGDTVIHPVGGRNLGRFYQYRGRATVVCIGARTATARVTMACTDIPMGSFLKPFEPIPIPLGRMLPSAIACDSPSGRAKGRIVLSRDGVVALGADANVMIDLGVADGIQPGDQLTIFRHATGSSYGIRPQGAYWVYTPPPAGVEVPRTYLGELAVLYVGDRWAMARIVDSSRLIEVGDEVELK